MRALLFFLISIFYLQQCEAQKVVVANLKMNVAYLGVRNSMSFAIEGLYNENFDITTNNGKIEQGESSGSFFFYPIEEGEARIYFKSKKTEKKFEYVVRVKSIPPPPANVGGYEGGDIPIKIWQSKNGISCGTKTFGEDELGQGWIQEYTVTIFRNEIVVFSGNYTNPVFSEELLKAFRSIRFGDRIIFSGIKCRFLNKDKIKLEPLIFTIIE